LKCGAPRETYIENFKERRLNIMKKLLLVTWVIILMSAIFFGSHGKVAVAEEKTIKIGALLPLTGPHSMWGSWYDHVFKFALEVEAHISQFCRILLHCHWSI